MSLRKKKIADLTAGDVVKLFVLANLANEFFGSLVNAMCKGFIDFLDSRNKEPEV